MKIDELRKKFLKFIANRMVKKRKDEIGLTYLNKDMKDWRVGFLTTAGVHLKTQQAFDVDAGDHSLREIPDNAQNEDVMITHTHL